MIRGGLSLLGGSALALLLFWGLALLVVPPVPSNEVERVTITLLAPPETPATAPDDESRTSESSPQSEPDLLPEPETVTEPEISPESQPEPEPVPKSQAESEMPSRHMPASQPAMASPVASPSMKSEYGSEVADVDEGSRGTPSEGPIDVGELLPLYRVPPEYPRHAQRRGLEGHVELVFLVAPDGRVETDSIQVVEALPGNVFERAARQAVSQWRFEASGQLLRARQRLEFQLR